MTRQLEPPGHSFHMGIDHHAGLPNAFPRMTFAVFLPTPAEASVLPWCPEPSRRKWSASDLRTSDEVLGLGFEKPSRTNQGLQFLGAGFRVVTWLGGSDEIGSG